MNNYLRIKQLALFTFAVVTLGACTSNENKSEAAATTEKVATGETSKITFEKEIFDFGVIKEGERVKGSFKFKNSGNAPLIISDASATCGCTVPEYPETPIKPGEEGVIKVIFDSANKVGMQDKIITLTTNATPKIATLHLVGEVEAKQ